MSGRSSWLLLCEERWFTPETSNALKSSFLAVVGRMVPSIMCATVRNCEAFSSGLVSCSSCESVGTNVACQAMTYLLQEFSDYLTVLVTEPSLLESRMNWLSCRMSSSPDEEAVRSCLKTRSKKKEGDLAQQSPYWVQPVKDPWISGNISKHGIASFQLSIELKMLEYF